MRHTHTHINYTYLKDYTHTHTYIYVNKSDILMEIQCSHLRLYLLTAAVPRDASWKGVLGS